MSNMSDFHTHSCISVGSHRWGCFDEGCDEVFDADCPEHDGQPGVTGRADVVDIFSRMVIS